MLKIFAPRLIPKECIPNKKIVYKNIWGNRKIIQRYDEVAEPTLNSTDANLAETMKAALININLPILRDSKCVKDLLNERKPIKVTSFRIDDDINPENNGVWALIKSGNVRIKYTLSDNDCEGVPVMVKLTTKEEIEAIESSMRQTGLYHQ